MISFNIVAGDGVSFSVGNGNSVSFQVQPIAHSIPAGGSDGQVLAKASNTDYDVEWVDQTGGGGGSSTLDGLTDVTITTVASGNFLRYNGTQWVNTTIQASDIPTGVDAAKIADGTVSNAEFQYLNGVTSAIQTQLDEKADEGTAVAFTSVNINGTGGNGHIHLKHQSADPMVSASSTGLWAAADGELYQKNDGNPKSKLLTAAQIGTDVQAYSSVLANTTASFTTADETKLDGIEALADVTDAGNVGSAIDGATAKTTPADGDTMPLIDSAASNVLKKVTWANIKATLKSYFDTLYQAAGSYLTSANITQTITNGVTDKAPSEDAVFDALAGKQAADAQLTDLAGLSYSGNGLKVIRVNAGETAFELATPSSSGGFYDPTYWEYYDHFHHTANISGYNYTISNSGTGSGGASQPSETDHPGVWRVSTGTTSTGFANLNHVQSTSWFYFNDGAITFEAWVKLPTSLSDGTDNYIVRCGLGQSTSGDGNNGAFFKYNHALNSGNWVFLMRAAGADVLTINTSSAAAANTWVRLKFTIAASTQAAEAFINGTSVGSGTPSSTIGAQLVGLMHQVVKSAGTTTEHFYIDSLYIKQVF